MGRDIMQAFPAYPKLIVLLHPDNNTEVGNKLLISWIGKDRYKMRNTLSAISYFRTSEKYSVAIIVHYLSKRNCTIILSNNGAGCVEII